METHFPCDCRHQPTPVERFQVVACPECGEVDWFEEGAPVTADVALAGLFGDYDLIDRLPVVSAPAPEVLVYRPPRRGRRRNLAAFPPHHWFRASPSLWLSHDGELLMLAPTDPLVVRNLTRGA